MRICIKRKLNSQSGASFLFALLALLVAVMVSVTIVSAAVTSVKRIHNDRKVTQARLTLESAAQLVRDEMEGTRYKISQTMTTQEDGTVVVVGLDKGAEGTFASEIWDAVEHIDTMRTNYSSNPGNNFSIEVKNHLDKALMKEVKVSFVMQTDYKLVFTFTLEGEKETLFLTMYSPGLTYVKTSDPLKVVQEIAWGQPVINATGV